MSNDSENLVRNGEYAESALRKREEFQKLMRRRNILKLNKNLISLWSYLFFILIRIVLVFIPQYGYIHPDEFFQTTEIINGAC
jgi:hypothetical protein